MKGVVFTEFLEMVEENISIDVAEEILASCELPSGGIYTSVGTYDYSEMLQLVMKLSSLTGADVPQLVQAFGRHLFGRFKQLYPELFGRIDSAFEFLSIVDNQIHVEVRKLYPDAELPRFETTRLGEDVLEMVYRSDRPFADLAEGLIAGCLQYFGETVEIRREVRSDATRFVLTRKAGVLACST